MNPSPPRKMTLGQLARTCGLARASLLNYEALGLLRPAGRSLAGYRLYGEAEVARLQTIRRYRDAGLSLPAIATLLDIAAPGENTGGATQSAMLEARLLALSQDVERLKAQQKMLARLLATPEFRNRQSCRGKAAWVALLRRAGFSEKDMRQWHQGFEADSPDAHASFLHALGLAADEIAAIRQWASAR